MEMKNLDLVCDSVDEPSSESLKFLVVSELKSQKFKVANVNPRTLVLDLRPVADKIESISKATGPAGKNLVKELVGAQSALRKCYQLNVKKRVSTDDLHLLSIDRKPPETTSIVARVRFADAKPEPSDRLDNDFNEYIDIIIDPDGDGGSEGGLG